MLVPSVEIHVLCVTVCTLPVTALLFSPPRGIPQFGSLDPPMVHIKFIGIVLCWGFLKMTAAILKSKRAKITVFVLQLL